MKQTANGDMYRPVTAAQPELRRVQAKAFVRLRLALFAAQATLMGESKRDTTAELHELRAAVDLYRACHRSDDTVVKDGAAALFAHDAAVRERGSHANQAWSDLVGALWPIYESLGSCL